MNRALAAWLLVACGPSLQQIEHDNQRAHADADARAVAAGPTIALPTTTIPLTANVASLAGSNGLEQDETLYTDATGQLVFVSTACAIPVASCGGGCEQMVEYTFHRGTRGQVVIVRERAMPDVVRTKTDPSCPALCGGGQQQGRPMPPTEIAGTALGVTSLAQVELRTVTYTKELIDRACTNTTPVP
jgi:hypothetical protein